MKNGVLCSVLSLFLVAAHGQNDQTLDVGNKLDSLPKRLNVKQGANYANEKAKIEKIRVGLSTSYLNASDSLSRNKILDSAKIVFGDFLLNNIIPYWYGTQWDFNGYTAIPKQGTIACGYFVSTTLKAMGLNINRYKLAQQNPENEALSIAIDKREVLRFNDTEADSVLKQLGNGLYFVGLSNHVGYLYVEDENSYFIHSDYVTGRVAIQHTIIARAFQSSSYYLSKISGNKLLIEKWLTKAEVRVVL